MINDEEYDLIVNKYFTKIRKIGTNMMHEKDVDIIRGVKEMNEALERIKEIRTIQREQKGEKE